MRKKWAVVSFLSDELVNNLAHTRSLFPNTRYRVLTSGHEWRHLMKQLFYKNYKLNRISSGVLPRTCSHNTGHKGLVTAGCV